MGDVIVLPVVRIERNGSELSDDGGRTRIQQRRKRLGLNEPFRGDDLTMDHADPEVVDLLKTAQQLPCDCA